MNNCLVVMNAREIPICIESIRKLKIAKAWFRGYTEIELESVMPEWMKAHDFDNYIIISDDTTPTKEALAIIDGNMMDREILTGWSNISPDSKLANLCYKPLMGSFPGAGSYKWTPIDMVLSMPTIFETFFMGFSLTAMRKHLWTRFPFKSWHQVKRVSGVLTTRGWGSDFMLSKRLRDSGIKMWCHKNGFVYHLASQENMIVGKVTPEVVFEQC